ncbi:MAG TPA: ferritin-like domain-containing protein, partial [Candidatus Elarobacter sp.]|nr:ferritin-like domain-containing protein [Candidatus Elarobacter sp.]
MATEEQTVTLDRSHIAPVTSREELIYLLSQASELEHGLACVYLFAAHSLKSDVCEGGLTDDQAAMVRRWKRRLSGVAIEEMLHLAQVANMLTAVGGAPHFRRTNFPLPSDAFPFGIPLSLEPFSHDLIERFVCYEMPEEGVLEAERRPVYDELRARVVDPRAVAEELMPTHCAVEPFPVDFDTVGEFYHKIGTGFTTIAEDVLFIGPVQAQANARYVDLDGALIPVLDRDSALRAIEMIVQQGEAPTSDHPDAHFCVFDAIRVEYEEEVARARAAGTPFEPVRPVLANPMTHFYGDTSRGAMIRDELTHNVSDLYNVAYDTMLLMLLRFFAHNDETEHELEVLSRGTLRLMASVLRPLGEALTKMPAGEQYPGKTAGPGFGFNRDVHLLPHKESAWIFFAERLGEMARKATFIRTHFDVPPEIEEAAAALQDIGARIGALSRAGYAGIAEEIAALEQALGTTIQPEHNGPYLVSNVPLLTNSKGETLPVRTEMALCRCGHSRMKPFCDGSHAHVNFSSAKSPERTPDRRVDYAGREVTIHDNRGTCCHSGNCSDHLPSVFKNGQEPWIDPNGASAQEIIDIVRACPSGALSCSRDGVEYRDVERAPLIYVSKDGPYHVQGGIKLSGETLNEGASPEHYALCRCG